MKTFDLDKINIKSDEEPSILYDSILVIILKCETRKCDKHIKKLKKIFSDKYFTVHVCDINNPDDLNDDILSVDKLIEKHDIYHALKYSIEGPYFNGESKCWWTSTPCLIIRDSSICQCNDIKNKIKKAIDRIHDADMIFLCKWNDKCEQYKQVDNNDSLKWSQSPTSTQAVIYRPKARKHLISKIEKSRKSIGSIINKCVSHKELTAAVFTPNIIEYDIDLARNVLDYKKLNICAELKNHNGKNDAVNTVWFISVSLLIILVAWFLVDITPIKNNKQYNF
jgi:hypothetical protein